MKAVFLFFTLIPSLVLNGQISITKEVEPEKQAPVYDSTINFIGYQIEKYIGQELYLLPKSEGLRQYGYENFLKDYKGKSYDRANIYKCCDGVYSSDYDSLVGKYFKVSAVFESPVTGASFLQLVGRKNGDTCYYEYNKLYESSFPFLVVGYYEKAKSRYVGKSFVLRYKGQNLSDYRTGQIFDFVNGSTWSCIDVTVKEQSNELALAMEDADGNRILMDLDGPIDYWEKSVAESYKRRFGGYWNVILERKIEIGMTEEMVIVSWGEPNSINEASYGDQWVYSSTYLYFKNGILTDFN